MFLITIASLLITSILLGIGLAMDAFCVSMSYGLYQKNMNIKRILIVALTFGIFQAVMPFIGFLLGHIFYEQFNFIEKYHIIPIIALAILSFLGIKMIIEGIRNKEEKEDASKPLSIKLLLIQAVATSLDALSCGFAFSNYSYLDALICVLIIGIITTALCIPGVFIGKKLGLKLGRYAIIIGGIILILIGSEIFITAIFDIKLF